jgi:hypothetical protein
VKSAGKSLGRQLQQAGSFLLVCLLLFISAAQVLHTHPDRHCDEHEQCGDKEQLQGLDKCAVCDYDHHVQGKQIFSHQSLIVVVALPQTRTINTRVLIGNYKFSLQGYTNKGPPFAV